MSRIKPFLNLYHWFGIEYPTVRNKNNNTLLNNKHRAKAKNDFGKNEYKFLNNSVLGRTT